MTDAEQRERRAHAELLYEVFREGWIRGFMSSGEGWNGEYPFGDKRRDPRASPEIAKSVDQSLREYFLSGLLFQLLQEKQMEGA